MLLLLQFAAFCQLFFLPGFLILRMLRCPASPLTVFPLTFVLSGLFNYAFVLLLSAFGVFHEIPMFPLLLAETGLLICFLIRDFRERKRPEWLEDLPIPPGTSTLEKAAFFLAAGVLLIQLGIAVRSFGSIFLSWDSVLSWNRWAVAWAEGRFSEQRTFGYPQLVPCNWAVAYRIIGEVLNFVPKGIALLCPAMISLIMMDLAVRRREAGLCLAIPLTAWFFRNTDPLAGGGEVDFMAAFYCFASIGFLLAAQEKHSWKTALCAGGAAICAACTKPSGIVFLVLLPILARILDFPPGRGFRRALGIYVLLALLFAAPYYLYFAGRAAGGKETSTFRTVTCEIYGTKNRAEIAAAAGKVFLCRLLAGVPTDSVRRAKVDFSGGIFRGVVNLYADRLPVLLCALLLSIGILVFARGVPVWSGLFYAVALPYTLVWMLFYSYDLRNLMPLQPLLACGAAFALVRILRTPSLRRSFGILAAVTAAAAIVPGILRADFRRLHREQETRIGSPGLNRELEQCGRLRPFATDYQFLEFLPGFGPDSFVFVEYSLPGDLNRHREAAANPAVKSFLVPDYAAEEFRKDLEQRLKNGEIRLQFRKYGYRLYEKTTP